MAVMNNNLDMIKLLIDAKANVNCRTLKFEQGISREGGKTPLDYATWRNYDEIIEYLLSKGAERGRIDLQFEN